MGVGGSRGGEPQVRKDLHEGIEDSPVVVQHAYPQGLAHAQGLSIIGFCSKHCRHYFGLPQLSRQRALLLIHIIGTMNRNFRSSVEGLSGASRR